MTSAATTAGKQSSGLSNKQRNLLSKGIIDRIGHWWPC